MPSSDTKTTSIQDRVRREIADFPEAERRVARALIADYPMAGLETVARFARRAQTSGPTILRFVARLGFDSYVDFQDAIRGEIQARLQGPLTRYDTQKDENPEPNLRMAQALQQNIETVERDLRKDLPRIVDHLTDPERSIFCIGGRFSRMSAAYLQHYLREVRPSVRLVRDSSAAWADYLLDVRPGDVVVIFDFRRYQRDVLDFAKGAAAQKAVILLVTDVLYSPIASISDFVIPCPVTVPSAFDSAVTGLAVVEIITASVVARLGERAKDRIATLETLRKPFNLGH